MHDHGVVIKDIKLENLLLRKPLKCFKKQLVDGTKDWGVVLADFGFSCLDYNSEKSRSCKSKATGTFIFSAPETRQIPSISSKMSDVYSFAVLILTTIYPQKFDFEVSDDHPMKVVTKGLCKLKMKLRKNKTYFPINLNHTLLEMLENTPEKRLTIKEVNETLATLI